VHESFAETWTTPFLMLTAAKCITATVFLGSPEPNNDLGFGLVDLETAELLPGTVPQE
jgi:hypothetical protein